MAARLGDYMHNESAALNFGEGSDASVGCNRIDTAE